MKKTSFNTRLARVATVTALAVALLTAPLANTAPAAAKGSFYFDFEEEVKPWTAKGLKPEGYQNLIRRKGSSLCGEPLNHYAVLDAGIATQKIDNLREKNAVPLPLGTWMESSFTAAPTPHIVEVSFIARSESNCEGCYVKAYAGATAPQAVVEFTDVDVSRYLKKYWQEYKYETTVDFPIYEGSEPILYLALGWENTDAAIAFDCVTVSFMPEK